MYLPMLPIKTIIILFYSSYKYFLNTFHLFFIKTQCLHKYKHFLLNFPSNFKFTIMFTHVYCMCICFSTLMPHLKTITYGSVLTRSKYKTDTLNQERWNERSTIGGLFTTVQPRVNQLGQIIAIEATASFNYKTQTTVIQYQHNAGSSCIHATCNFSFLSLGKTGN